MLSFAKSVSRAVLPESMHQHASRRWQQLKHFGLQRYCPLCRSYVRSFLPHGTPVRPQAVCPVCRCKEAHRLAFLYLSQRTNLLHRACTLLHVAPEPDLSVWLRRQPLATYVSGDLCFGVGDICLNLCRLPFADASFDIVYSAHVLNAIPDERAAMAEVARVLKPGGVAIMNVPLNPNSPTQEPTDDTVEARVALCHDPDIYRIYGHDLPERLADCGLQIELEDFYGSLSPAVRERMGLQATPVVRCSKPTQNS